LFFLNLNFQLRFGIEIIPSQLMKTTR